MSVFGSVFGAGSANANAAPHLPYEAGVWYGEPPVGGSGPAAIVADTLIAIPWEVKGLGRFDQVSINITTGAAGLAGIAIYGQDDALIGATAMTINTTSIAAPEVALAAAVTLFQPGIYWLALLSNAAPTLTCYTTNATTMQNIAAILGSPAPGGLYTSSAGSRYARRSVARAFASGFPPSLSAATRSSSTAPIIAIRAAA